MHGSKLFNCLPQGLRNMTGVNIDAFKGALDKFLQSVPDEPQIPGYTAMRRAPSNSILEMKTFCVPAFQDAEATGRRPELSP